MLWHEYIFAKHVRRSWVESGGYSRLHMNTHTRKLMVYDCYYGRLRVMRTIIELSRSVGRSYRNDCMCVCVCLVVVNTFLKGNPLGYKSNVSCKQTSSRPNSGIHNSQGSSFSSQPSFSLLYTSSSYTAAILEMENIKIQQEKILHTPYSSSCES